MKKPWQGRFSKETADAVLRFTASLPYDRRLALYDIRGSKAHVTMLAKCGILTAEEAKLINKGLGQIKEEIESGSFSYDLTFEDIHMNIEKRLIELIGPVGGKMHTARSRNDQVALDMHIYVKEESRIIDRLLLQLQGTIIKQAVLYKDVIMPGYTHLQHAQPVLLAHHLLAYFWMFKRDRDRLKDMISRTDMMPLGAGAIAGTSFQIDREMVADSLGFKSIYENSMDAVSDRDFVVEFLSFAAILMMHLSRFCEEMVIWSTSEFNFIELDDAHTTGSSMMPQKKNPDVAELIRGKTGRVYGSLVSILTVLKALPLAYNRDMQEDKEGLFDTIDTLKVVLPLFSEMLQGMAVNRQRLNEVLDNQYIYATDIADFLVRKGVTFREAHHATGRMIAYSLQRGSRIENLSPEERKQFHPELEASIKALLDPYRVIEARSSRGGTSIKAVEKQLQAAVDSINI